MNLLTPTEEISSFICSLQYNDIPITVIDKIKCSLLDGISCGCYGSATSWGEIAADFVKELNGKEESSLWLSKFKGPSVNVALALGVLIHSFDYDDYHKAKVHPGSVVIPAAITLAEREKSSSKEFLTALVVGYETMIRIALSVDPSSSRLKGWHLTGTCGVFGAAAAASKLLKLNKTQTAWALGLAGTQASGLWAFNYDGAMSKRFHPGRSSQSGIMAAILAQKGFTGPLRILDAEDGGFWNATSDNPKPEELISGLSEDYKCLDICLKPYPCCGSNHSSIDAVLSLLNQHNISTSDIEKVTIYTSEVVKVQTGFDFLPTTVLQAQMSLKFAIAIAVIYQNFSTEHINESYFNSKQVHEVMRKVVVEVDAEMDQLYPKRFCSKVIMSAKNSTYECKVLDPTGSKEKPLKWEQVVSKASDLIKDTIDANDFRKLTNYIYDLENVDVLTIIDILR